jgi:hypothetical protein
MMIHTPLHLSQSLAISLHRVACIYYFFQDIATNGFAGALNGGLLTAHGVLGYSLFDLLVCDTNVITDMAKASKKK